jgi:hypothetical protein
VAIRIYRETDDTELAATFFPGSAIRAADLNADFDQTLYVVQEVNNYAVKLDDPLYVNKTYIDAQDATKVNKAGDTMTGPLAMSGQKITGLGDPTNAQDAATKTWVETSTGAPLAQFRSIFYGALPTDPAADPLGNPSTTGDLYFNTSSNVMRVYNGVTWQDASANANVLRWRKTAVGGETSLSGADDNAATLTYTVNLEFVYLNGVLLQRGVDYTASNGTSIDGLVALEAGDVVEVLSYSSFSLVNVPGSTIQDGTISTQKFAPGAVVGASFTQAGAGAVARTIDSKLKDAVSFADFGCVGDGSDEATKLQDALTYASANQKAIVDFSGKTYNYGTTLNVGAIEMYGNFTLNGTGSAFVNVTGSLTEVGYISAATTAGGSTVTMSSVSGLAADDLLILWNSVTSSYSVHRTNYYDGEFARVAGVSGSNVTLQSNLLTSYSGVTTDKVFKSSGIRVVIDGPSFTGAGVFALRVQYADNALIKPRRVRTTGNQAALVINKCYNVLVESGFYYTPYTGVGGNYGISVSNSQFVTIRNVDAYGGRHAVTTGGDADNGAAPCRYVYVEDSVLSNDPAASIYNADFHGNTLDSHYKNCTIYGRVGLAGERIAAIGCDVHSWPSSTAAPLGYHELVGGECLFKDCRAIVGDGSTAFAIVNNLASSLTDDIARAYQIVVDGLDATLNSNVTTIVNAFENSSRPNAWVLDGLAIRGTLSGLTRLIAYSLVAPGVDASYIYIRNPKFDTSLYTLVTKSGTTLAATRYIVPPQAGSNANGSWAILADGTMVSRHLVADTAAISTAFLGGFRTGGITWTYPQAFTATPEITVTPANGSAFAATISSKTTASCVFFGNAVTSQTSAARQYSVTAVGRWI